MLTNILFGLECETSSFKENLNKRRILKNLIPELVEKKDPPIIIKIKNINDKSLGISFEKPIFEIELQIPKKIEEKSLFIFKNTKKKKTKKIK